MGHEPLVALIPIAEVRARAVQARIRQQIAHAPRERGAAPPEHDHRDARRQRAHPEISSRQISAIAKYGTTAGSISDKGAMR